jgi:ActR/RegA family two-component response regulator
MAVHYFAAQKSKKASLRYYRNLARAIERRDHSVEKVVKKAMHLNLARSKKIRWHLKGEKVAAMERVG